MLEFLKNKARNSQEIDDRDGDNTTIRSSVVMKALSSHMKCIIHSCVGGTQVSNDINILKNGVHVVVGCPGRTYDMIMRRALSLKEVLLERYGKDSKEFDKHDEVLKYVKRIR